jgi:hypothetical protein
MYPLDDLHAELAFLAYYLHWPRGELLGLEHTERRRWVEEVSRINDDLTQATRSD